jgi:hypothetical protein
MDVFKILSTQVLEKFSSFLWLLWHLYNPWLITIRIVAHKIFEKTTLQAIKAKEEKISLFPVGDLLGGTLMQTSFFNSRAQRFDAQCWSTPNAWCTPFKQHWKQHVCDYKQHSVAMAMVYHKRESIGNGVSWECTKRW